MIMGNDDMNNNEMQEEQLPVLQLPEGVSTHDIALLVNEVLLQRIISEKLPWAQWILLAALEILAEREVPHLDKETLEILQGTLNGSSFPHNISPEEEHQDQSDLEEDARNNPVNDDDQPLCKDDQTSSSFLRLGKYVEKKDFEVQVTPKIMKRTSSKWIQVHICKTSNKGIQKSTHCSDSATQTSDITPKIQATDKKLRNVDIQTILVYYKDAAVQYTSCGAEEETVWKLIPITDIPERKSSRASASSSDEGFTDEENRQEPLLCGNFSPMEKVSVFKGNPSSNIKLFHGRPLIGKGSNKQAADIPPNPIHNDPVIMLQDPRDKARKL